MGKTRATMAPGDVIAGRYRVDALIGQGGFGVVFRATQLPIGRSVALKMLLDEALAHADGRARFRREAELAQRLEHPNTVRLYDFGETEEGLPFIAWELLKGRSLDEVLAAEGPLGPARVARIAGQTLKALMEAHGVGIVHRDIKPSNIFLCAFSGESDFVKVLDFGIAKNTLTRGTGLTPEGSVLGTPAYMAPEQLQAGAVSPATDLYSLGLLMGEMLTGQPVFAGASALEVITAQLAERPTPLAPEVLSSPLGPVIARATERSPARRYRSAAEMLQHLEAVLEGAHRAPSAGLGSAPTSAVVRPAAASMALAATAHALVPPPESHAAALADTGYVALPPAPAPPSPSPRTAPALVALPATYPPAFPAPAPALARPAPGSRGLVVAAAAGGAVLTAALVLGGLYAGGIFDARPPAVRAAPGPGAPASSRGLSALDDAQIRARIEAARYKVTTQDQAGWTTTWHLVGSGMSYVQIIRYPEPTGAELAEKEFLKQPGATARDGGTLLHVRVATPAASRALLAQITR